MRRILLCSAAFLAIVVVGTALWCHADEDKPPADPIRELQNRIGYLELRVTQLEQTLAFREAVPGEANRLVPGNWSRQEFNGMTYYVVPLSRSPIRNDAP